MTPDFGKTAEDYRRHRAGFPESLFERLARVGIGVPGQVIVDLGTGTGTLARGFARRGSRVIGIDPAGALLAEARELDVEAGVAVEYQEARAEDTGLGAATATWSRRASAGTGSTGCLRGAKRRASSVPTDAS